MTSGSVESGRQAELVRRNALPAAIAATLLCYFGFARLELPTGSGLFEWANWVFYHTVRVSGILMAGVAMLSLTGHRAALYTDAVVSLPLGALFVLCGPAMLIGGGDLFNGALIFLFGMMFIRDGFRSIRTVRQAVDNSECQKSVQVGALEVARSGAVNPATNSPPGAAMKAVERTTHQLEREAAQTTGPGQQDHQEHAADREVESGYLAAFARKPPPNPEKP